LQTDAVTITASEPERPTAELLRRLTDRRVFEQLLSADSLTRAEIAARTGISKPTISESMRRLTDAGLVVESGRQVGSRGRAGTYYRLGAEHAAALAVSIGPDGIVADTFDLQDRPVAHAEQPVAAPVEGSALGPLLRATVATVREETPGTIRGCVVSMAGPVDRRTGQLATSTYSPFLAGAFAPGEILGPVAPVVEVDNDVNWAALAERERGNATDLDDFTLCYLGEGIGGSVVINGDVVRGSRGLAGELAHARTTGPGGRSATLVECFAAWDLLVPGSAAIDVGRVRAVLEGGAAADRSRTGEIAAAVAGAISSVVALLDPQGVLVGGPWGCADGFVDQIAERLDVPAAGEVALRPTALTQAPYRTGIRIRAVAAARQAVADTF
jgi:predicted NBD/HSP70 family sugar kinase/biotin operon repressor